MAEPAALAQLVADLHERLRDSQLEALGLRDMLHASLDLANELQDEVARQRRRIESLCEELRQARGQDGDRH